MFNYRISIPDTSKLGVQIYKNWVSETDNTLLKEEEYTYSIKEMSSKLGFTVDINFEKSSIELNKGLVRVTNTSN
jgi:hypothetical protein